VGDFSLPCGIPPVFYTTHWPHRGGHTRALRKGVAVTLRLIPPNGEQDSRGPRGMAHCVWLLTFEQPCDLPPVYEWFGRQQRRGCVIRHRS
jgi:hypothetical protein